jgi:hypothetical protein
VRFVAAELHIAMPERTTIRTASRNPLCMEFAVFTTSHVDVIYACRETRSWVSSNAISSCRLPIGYLFAFRHLEEKHADAREHSSDYHGG